MLASLDRGEPPDPRAITWFREALLEWIRGGSTDMAGVFGLPPSIRNLLRQVIRDHFLMLAWDALRDQEDAPKKPRAEKLAAKVRHYQDCSQTPSDLWSKPRLFIWQAAQYGDLPQGWLAYQRIFDRYRR